MYERKARPSLRIQITKCIRPPPLTLSVTHQLEKSLMIENISVLLFPYYHPLA